MLAYVLTIGDVSRFRRGKQLASYVGLIPWEETFWRTAEAGSDHETRQSLAGLVSSGSGADCSALQSPLLPGVSASLPSDASRIRNRDYPMRRDSGAWVTLGKSTAHLGLRTLIGFLSSCTFARSATVSHRRFGAGTVI